MHIHDIVEGHSLERNFMTNRFFAICATGEIAIKIILHLCGLNGDIKRKIKERNSGRPEFSSLTYLRVRCSWQGQTLTVGGLQLGSQVRTGVVGGGISGTD